ncbi:Zinc finger BED domain-containing protein 4 [Eumeta japonica]|uniref:Zinc finger BED domain-containing protein 4 n=1 Tax=Eumeta variegata TaxID=151549 RepID=A0A4C1ZJ99_EUMVA|nr:Zinc finger BED domain-containing protein 4 [Eumeta japonica]
MQQSIPGTSGSSIVSQSSPAPTAPPPTKRQKVETRWNSVFYMIERIVELQDAVRSTLALVVRNLPILSSEDWTTCAQLCQILRPFEEMTKAMSGEKYLTGSFVIIMVRCLKEPCKKILGNTEFVSSVRDVALKLQLGLEERFQRVEQSGTLALNTFLDSHFKTQAFSDTNKAAKTKERIRKLVAAQIAKHQTNPIPSKSSTEKKTDNYSPWDIFDGLINQNESSGTPLSKAIKEADMYLADDILLRRNASGEWNSPFVWWKNHRHVYPNLLKLFIQNCNIVATSVPCERMFSKSGLLINSRRTRLTTRKVEKIMFLNVNLSEQRFQNYY